MVGAAKNHSGILYEYLSSEAEAPHYERATSCCRLLALLPTLLFASLIVFVIVRMVPGDVVDLMLSQNDISADAKSRDDLIRALGLDQPMWRRVPALGRQHRAARRPGPVAVAGRAGAEDEWWRACLRRFRLARWPCSWRCR
ncbi:hypothetical protein ACU4GD_04885 [Cupriavidus basilensis]